MIIILDKTTTVEGTVGSKKQKVGAKITEEESNDNKSAHINNSDFFDPYEILFFTQRWQ